MSNKIPVTFAGYDWWSRPVYKTPQGTLLVDIAIADDFEKAYLHTVVNNEWDGEPNHPIDMNKVYLKED